MYISYNIINDLDEDVMPEIAEFIGITYNDEDECATIHLKKFGKHYLPMNFSDYKIFHSKLESALLSGVNLIKITGIFLNIDWDYECLEPYREKALRYNARAFTYEIV